MSLQILSWCSFQDTLVDCVRYQLPCLLSQRSIGLVIIDSVASPFRVEDSSLENKDLLHTLGYKLHYLAETCNIAVVTINQVCSYHHYTWLCHVYPLCNCISFIFCRIFSYAIMLGAFIIFTPYSSFILFSFFTQSLHSTLQYFMPEKIRPYHVVIRSMGIFLFSNNFGKE